MRALVVLIFAFVLLEKGLAYPHPQQEGSEGGDDAAGGAEADGDGSGGSGGGGGGSQKGLISRHAHTARCYGAMPMPAPTGTGGSGGAAETMQKMMKAAKKG